MMSAEDLKMYFVITQVLFLFFAPILLLITWSDYKGLRWIDYDFKRAIRDLLILFIVLFILGVISNQGPQTDWVETPHGGFRIPVYE